MKPNHSVELSVIIPAYNEEKRIGKTLKVVSNFLDKKKISYEILIVDDGSRDKTQEVVKAINLPHLKILSYGENRGKGYAVYYGVHYAGGKWILFADADNSTPIQQFDSLWAASFDFPVVTGSRYLPESRIAVRQGVPRIIMSRLGNILVQLLILPGIKDSQCGFKLFERSAAKNIFARQTIWRWGFDMEILRIAKEQGYKIKEVPIRWLNDDQSRLQSRTVFVKTLLELLAIKRNSIFGCYRKNR